jgi:hypothetical protein
MPEACNYIFARIVHTAAEEKHLFAVLTTAGRNMDALQRDSAIFQRLCRFAIFAIFGGFPPKESSDSRQKNQTPVAPYL